MRIFNEGKILNDLIEINIDACRFYHRAATKADTPEAEKSFHRLERLHNDIVKDLGIAAYKNGDIYPDNETYHDRPKIFKDLYLKMPAAANTLVNALEKAENRCLETLQEAIDSDDVSIDIKMHVADAVSMLQKRHEYISTLRSIS